MTKEEILDKHVEDGCRGRTRRALDRYGIFDCRIIDSAMDEYAKQQAIAFEKWKAEKGYESGFDMNGELQHNDSSYRYFSTAELYDEFILFQQQITNT